MRYLLKVTFTMISSVSEIRMSENDMANIIAASQYESFYQAQLMVQGLEKLSYSTICDFWRKLLINPTELGVSCKGINLEHKFTQEEDALIVVFLKCSNVGVDDFWEFIKDRFSPYLSKKDIFNRIDYWKNGHEEEVDRIMNMYIEQIISEEMYSNPSDEESTYSYHPYKFYVPGENIDNEILNLHSRISLFASVSFQNTDLAILRSEKNQYIIKREAVLIGRSAPNAEVDINLALECDKECVQVSRKQAIISFFADCNFYIENIGRKPFRVNGVLINPGKICLLPHYSVLDFSSIVLVFLPNLQLIKKISSMIINM